MNIQRFQNSPIGELVPIEVIDGEDRFSHFAYVPNPLKTSVKLTSRQLMELDAATLALGRLDGAANRLLNPWLLARPAIRREAVSSSSLEGTVSTLSDLLVVNTA